MEFSLSVFDETALLGDAEFHNCMDAPEALRYQFSFFLGDFAISLHHFNYTQKIGPYSLGHDSVVSSTTSIKSDESKKEPCLSP